MCASRAAPRQLSARRQTRELATAGRDDLALVSRAAFDAHFDDALRLVATSDGSERAPLRRPRRSFSDAAARRTDSTLAVVNWLRHSVAASFSHNPRQLLMRSRRVAMF